jgi:hypothetical protein
MMKRFISLLLIFFVVFAEKNPKINGFFVQPMLGYGVPNFEGGFQTQQYYDDWIKSMADVGATMLFYQWVSHYEANQDWFSSAYGGASSADFCYYSPDLKQISGVAVNSWMHAIKSWTKADVSPIQRILDAGEKNGVKIWLGLYLNEDNTGQTFNWWNAVNDNNIDAKDSAIFRYHVERSVDLVKDLTAKFGTHKALGGFYYPVEIANLGFEKRENWNILAWLLDSVAVEVHSLSNKKLAISPFFNVALTPAKEWGEMWDYVLSKSAIDIIMLQDGAGVEPYILTETTDLVSPYYKAVRDACVRSGKAFWANSELFTNPDGDRGNPTSKPSNIEQILRQLRTEAEFADTFVCFSFLSLDPFSQTTPFNTDYPFIERKKLYDDYKAYYESIKNETNDTKITIKQAKLNLVNYQIYISDGNIIIPKIDLPASYSLVLPNGKVILSGVTEKNSETLIKSPILSAGIYIFMLQISGKSTQMQKIFSPFHNTPTIDYQLRSW